MQTSRPQFSNLGEFADHIQGKSWDYIKPLYCQECEALAYIGELPWKKALKDPYSDYEHGLGMLLHYFRDGVLPLPLLEKKNSYLRQTLERINKDLTDRGQWPPQGTSWAT